MKSLRTRFLVLVMIPVILIFGAIGTYTLVNFYRQQTASAIELTETLTTFYSEEVKNELTEALIVAETMAVVVSSQVEKGQTNRDVLNDVLKDVLLANQHFFGIWLGMESNAYDGVDVFYVNTEHHDSTGRFIPYWYRDGDQTFLTHLEGYESQDYYQLAFQSGKTQLLEPFSYPVDGKEVLVTTIAVPIKHGTRVIGVAGVDIAVERLQEITAALKIYDSGFGRLLTNTGVVVYHPDQGRVGDVGEEFLTADGLKILEDTQKDIVTARWTEAIGMKTQAYHTYVPIAVGDIENRWVFGAVAVRDEMFATTNEVLWRLISVTVVGFIILGLGIVVASGTITKPIGELTLFIEKIAQLDLRSEHKEAIAPLLKKQDEVGMIAKALETMRIALSEVTTQLQDISTRVAGDSLEIASAVGENSAAIEEVTSSMGEFGSSVARTRDQSVYMSEDAKAVANLASDGNDQMRQTLEAMRQIVQLSEQSREALTTLSSQVATMESILEIIGDVADQTNLLALNAAIEAARAGEYGRGFAVVADEVRSLAEQTQQSVGEINQMVNQLTHNALTSTQLMDGTEEQIQIGNDLLAQTEVTFNQIAERINAIGQLIQEFAISLEAMNDTGASVAAASQEQAASMGEIAKNVEHLSDLGGELQTVAQRFII